MKDIESCPQTLAFAERNSAAMVFASQRMADMVTASNSRIASMYRAHLANGGAEHAVDELDSWP